MAKNMPTPNQIENQINRLVRYLVEVGLADDQGFVFQRSGGGNSVEITFQGASQVSSALKNRSYDEIYQHFAQARAYNVKLPDGAMIQMMYEFSKKVLQRHRLAFFPSPRLEQFQNDPNIYLDDEIYADIVAKNIVPVPIRFDYDIRNRPPQELDHPKSHMTVGQYKNCRIPVTAPMTPGRLMDFILRNFYHTAFARYANDLPAHSGSFADSIVPSERSMIHVVIPA